MMFYTIQTRLSYEPCLKLIPLLNQICMDNFDSILYRIKVVGVPLSKLDIEIQIVGGGVAEEGKMNIKIFLVLLQKISGQNIGCCF